MDEIGFSGTRNQQKNEIKASWTRYGFLYLFFCQIFGISEDFLKFRSVPRTLSILKNDQICQKFDKK